MSFKIRFSCISHIGKVRSINQDNFICDGKHLEVDGKSVDFPIAGEKSTKSSSVFGIFDGMGGEECGEIASYIAAKDAAALTIGKDVISDLSKFCQKANSDICEYSVKNNVSAMGTTAAMLVFSEHNITLCNIGDSKVFHYYDDTLNQISKDHIMISAYGVKPPLSQNLGIPPTELIIEPYFAQGGYNNNDIYLICSDGLTDMVSNEEISDVLKANTIDDSINNLLDKALANGGKDNISIILCKVKKEPIWFFKTKHNNLKEGV